MGRGGNANEDVRRPDSRVGNRRLYSALLTRAAFLILRETVPFPAASYWSRTIIVAWHGHSWRVTFVCGYMERARFMCRVEGLYVMAAKTRHTPRKHDLFWTKTR